MKYTKRLRRGTRRNTHGGVFSRVKSRFHRLTRGRFKKNKKIEEAGIELRSTGKTEEQLAYDKMKDIQDIRNESIRIQEEARMKALREADEARMKAQREDDERALVQKEAHLQALREADEKKKKHNAKTELMLANLLPTSSTNCAADAMFYVKSDKFDESKNTDCIALARAISKRSNHILKIDPETRKNQFLAEKRAREADELTLQYRKKEQSRISAAQLAREKSDKDPNNLFKLDAPEPIRETDMNQVINYLAASKAEKKLEAAAAKAEEPAEEDKGLDDVFVSASDDTTYT
jgi:hypothetical protein